MNVSKKEFKVLLTDWLRLREDAENLKDAFRKFDPDFSYISFARYDILFLKMLEMLVEDKSEWISWWVYECDCGKNKRIVNGCRTKEGKKIPMKTIENLYDCITKY